MRRRSRVLGLSGWLSLGVMLCACSTAAGLREGLPQSVAAYGELLRWGKLDGAASFHVPENQAAFVARYAAAEDDLHIESIEVRSVAFPPVGDGEPMAALVTVVAHAYLLPSTIVEKKVIVQRWEHRDGAWRIVSAEPELAPPLPDTGAPLDSGVAPPDTGSAGPAGGDSAQEPNAGAAARGLEPRVEER